MAAKDLTRHLATFDLSEAAVMAVDLRAARAAMGTVRGLRYKNVTTTARAAAVASGFVKVA